MRKLIGTLAALASVALLTVGTAGIAQAKVDRETAATSGTRVTAAAGTVYRCPRLYLCTYTGKNFTGTMHMMLHCREYEIPYEFHSWVNNQSSGTRAEFRNVYHTPIYTTPAPVSKDNDSGTLGAITWYIKPCK